MAKESAKPGIFVSRTDYLRRHLRVVGPYATPRKLANLALNEIEMRLARPRPRSVPPYLKIESTPLCHMSCAGCWHHSKDYKATLEPTMHMNVERLTAVVDPIAKDLLGVSLSNTGEPLLNRRLPELVAYLHGRRVCTTFPTNLSVRMSTSQAEALVAAGLDLMLVSLDGASEESYLQYRIGGNFDLVLTNVRLLAEAKRRVGARRPILIWKMVVFPHNEHEIDVVTRTWASLGFDGYEFVLDHNGTEHKAAADKIKRDMVTARKPCFWAWNTAVVGWDGGVQPCCKQLNEIRLGNAASDGLETVWRSEAYARLRSGFARDRYGEAMHPVCRRCVGLDTGSEQASSEAKSMPVMIQLRPGPPPAAPA